MNQRIPSSSTVRLGRLQPQAPGHRTIFCNDRQANLPVRFKGNSISTTKYNFFTFLPKGLFEQFRRVANLYFLSISILSTTPISPVSPITNVLPLTLVLLLSLIKEAFEDWKRFQSDMAVNNNLIDVLQDQEWVSIPWKKLQVGDIVKVKQDGFFPADLLFLASTNVDGVCYIETANLDGETNLKIRKAMENTWDYLTPDKASEFKGKLLMATRTHLFWTPCAAHCLDLMLEDIGKLPRVKRTIKRGISLVGYIYNHTLTLNIMRQLTHKKELVRHGVTRFATTFLTLQRLYSLKNDLRKMFISDEWLKSNNAKETKGKRVADIVLMPTFWGDVIYILKAMAPIVKVLRLVDNEKRPAMGYIYEAMDRAKESIRNSFKGDEAKFKEIFSIIDRRWECQLHHPLHAAGHYLNPQFFYGNPQVENDPEVMDGLYKCIERLSTSSDDEDKALDEISLYRRAAGLFGIKAAIRKRSTMAPGEIQCEQPNNSLYTFTGNLIIHNRTIPVSPNQLLLRGCSLRNTEYIVGVVIFTGHETKVMMNAMNVPSKRSTLERKLDKLILTLFAALFAMCFIGAVGSAIFVNKKYFYLHLESSEEGSAQFDPRNRFLVFLLTMFTLITLYSTVIPISLYVSIEMIKFIQSTQFINKDLHMYHSESNTPALARTSNLNEELGQVEYIFSDKTGTLTRNLMEFFKCSIGVEAYGNGVTEIEKGIAERSGLKLEENISPNAVQERGFNFDDARLMRGGWRNEPNPDSCKEFFRCLAICHTVLPEGEETPEKISYQAASPDEAALVIAAKNFGFFFYRRTPTVVYIRESHVEKMGTIQDVSYEILNVLEFNSTRKRQSVVCRYPNGRLVLYCKGADTVIYERLADGYRDIKKVTREYLEQFGSAGLRTLCLAYKELHPHIYESWNEKFIQAKSSLHDREKKLDEVAELIENDLILIGSTAIEDKLQEGVPACIETLQRAGIKIWVLTGDKIETAINIGYACSLLNNEMKQFIISSETDAIREVEDRGDQVEIARFIKEEVGKELKKCLEEAQSYFSSLTGPKLALVIDGKCLMYALDPSLRVMLLNLSLNCHAVVCCRVSPLQKAQVTTLVKKGARKITLSIGDGANDVSMIQAAHVGVGISGLEGMQAVMASDFAIAQFRFLADLLLVHGRWSYFRICKVVTYFFYKNLTFTLTQFWFTFQTGFSGQRFYDDWFQSLYNVIFTALPVIIVGLFDKDVSVSLSKKYPELYREGIRNVFFKWRVVAIWAFFSVYQSLIFFYFVSSSSVSAKNSEGKIFGLWDVSTMAFTCVVVTVNLQLLMICNSITRWHYISVGGSILAWFLFVFIYSGISTPYDEQENMYFVIYVLMSTLYFYLLLILVPVTALLSDFVYEGVQRWFFPYDYQIIQEMHRHESDDTSRAQLLDIGNQLTPAEARSHAISQLPREISKHTGFAFDSPGYESFFAAQLGVFAPQKAWDVARRASMRSRTRIEQKK